MVKRGSDAVVNEMPDDMGLLDLEGRPRKGDDNPDNAWRLRQYCRQYTLEAIEGVARIMRGPDPRLALSAAQMILERGWGKPIQQMEVGGPGDFTELTDEQLEEFIKETSAQIEKNELLATTH